ncbi:MAG: hypothetical protein IT426_15550 [Pirellulales bacterium]|nr:hypothetical protein [Pirellulales bacterium]
MQFSEQDDDRHAEDDAPEPTGFRFQFGISTLLYIMTGLAVLCGFISWLGLLPILLVISLAGGTFLGLLLCNYWDLGFAFEDLRWDVAKCFIIAGITILPGAILVLCRFEYFPTRSCVILSGLAYFFSLKMAWLDMENPEILIAFLAAVIVMALTVVAFSPLLRA